MNWLNSENAFEMFNWIYEQSRPSTNRDFMGRPWLLSDRKVRLLACACCRLDELQPMEKEFVRQGEMIADKLMDCRYMSTPSRSDGLAYRCVLEHRFVLDGLLSRFNSQVQVPKAHAELLRDMVGDIHNYLVLSNISAVVLSNISAAARDMAKSIYETDGFFDATALSVLADYMEEKDGFRHDDVLSHLRNGKRHAKGCYVIDAILDKE